jgi:hypothetical protein
MGTAAAVVAMLGLLAAADGGQLATRKSPPGGPLGPVDHIVVEAVGQSGKYEGPQMQDFCKGFRPTPAQVRDFLQHAVVITHGQEHDSFEHGPCVARGTLATRYGTWRWELHDMGTAQLIADGDDTYLLLGDPRQESSLSNEPIP